MEGFKQFAMMPAAFQDSGKMDIGPQRHYDLPTPTTEIPTKSIDGTIEKIQYTTNPIAVYVAGHKWTLTKKQWDYLKSQGKELKENQRIRIELYLNGAIKSVDILNQIS